MEVLSYERFEIRPALRQVWVDGTPSMLGARAFDLLMLLVDRRDRVVSKDQILQEVWPHLVIEENNLSVQISALRRVLGPQAITTVTGRGYRFTAQPRERDDGATASPLTGNLPGGGVAILGREIELSRLLDERTEISCVTLCGLAGVGKTALAGHVARRLAERHRYAQGVWQVDLATVRDGSRLAPAICEVLGIALDARRDPLEECVAHLTHRDILLLLDNCDHLIDAVAAFVERLPARPGRTRVLTTGHEPLRVPGERILRLAPLAVPASAAAADADDQGAMRMLLARVRDALGQDFEPTPAERLELIEICRQLDGWPLALELAAARVPTLGLAGVRSRLGDRLHLLAGGARTAPPRHRSLQAALEWSHQLLAPATRRILHRLAVFPSGFGLAGARRLLAIDADADADADAELVEHLGVLVERSWLSVQGGAAPRYRLLETTRAFALDCLAAECPREDWQRRHAATLCRICLQAARERNSIWMWQEMPNARAALDWALASREPGDMAVTIATYTSVVLAAGGAIREALDNLLRVQHLLDDSCPPALIARYWHWRGRLGVEGRLPSRPCIEALKRSDALFAALGEPRHRHACQRHLAEAELRAGHLDQAEHHLQAARRLETGMAAPADRMRRLRVEAQLADARQQHALALRHARTALRLAEAHGVERYRLLLMADMAWSHLQRGHAPAAVAAFGELLQHLDQSIRQGLARARALSGLTAALVAAGRIDEARRSVGHSVLALQQANLLHSRCDVFAWVAAASGDAESAARLIGVGSEFVARTETERDPVSRLAYEQALALIGASLGDEDLRHWRAQGALASDAELLHLLASAFAPEGRDIPAEAQASV